MTDLPSAIFRRWVHSREEDSAELTIYRPADFAFPPSRGRDGIELRPGGEFVSYSPGPTDRSAATRGRWQADPASLVEVRFEDPAARPWRFTLIAVDDSVLKLRRQP